MFLLPWQDSRVHITALLKHQPPPPLIKANRDAPLPTDAVVRMPSAVLPLRHLGITLSLLSQGPPWTNPCRGPQVHAQGARDFHTKTNQEILVNLVNLATCPLSFATFPL
jgi:hypothetical protein